MVLYIMEIFSMLYSMILTNSQIESNLILPPKIVETFFSKHGLVKVTQNNNHQNPVNK